MFSFSSGEKIRHFSTISIFVLDEDFRANHENPIHGAIFSPYFLSFSMGEREIIKKAKDSFVIDRQIGYNGD